jgi:hypothetical protein
MPRRANCAESGGEATGHHGPHGIDGAPGRSQGRVPRTGRDGGVRVDPDDLARGFSSIHGPSDSLDMGQRVHAGEEFRIQRNSLDGLDEALKIRQRSGHLLDDGSESTLVLRMAPAGIVSTARFVVEQSDRCQILHPGSGGSTVLPRTSGWLGG